MTASHDPEYGELRVLVTHLDAVHAEMITGDLRDLRIPAVMTRQTLDRPDPGSGEIVDGGLFQVLVPEAFVEIASEVLDVTHLQKEGPATEAEILAGFEREDPPPDPFAEELPRPSLLARSERAGRLGVKLGLAVCVAVFLTLMLRACA